MRIYIMTNEGRYYKIPAPLWLAKSALGLGNLGLSIGKKYIPMEQRQYVDCIDLKMLRKGFDVLKDYKGLTLVQVKSSNGAEIKIVI